MAVRGCVGLAVSRASLSTRFKAMEAWVDWARMRSHGLVTPSRVALAVFGVLAVAGTADAASEAIDGSQIKDGTITAAKVVPYSIGPERLKDGAVTLRTLAPGVRALIGGGSTTGPTGATGSAGASASAGATGAAGQAGPTGATGSAGASASTGATGAAGQAGPTGATGLTGAAGATGQAGSTGPAGATGAAGSATFFQLDGPFSQTLQATGAGTLVFTCIAQPDYSNGGFSIQFAAVGSTIFWVDDNGSISEQTMTNNQVALPDNVATGNHHIVLRATNGSHGGEWDIFASSNGTNTCEMSVQQNVASLSSL